MEDLIPDLGGAYTASAGRKGSIEQTRELYKTNKQTNNIKVLEKVKDQRRERIPF